MKRLLSGILAALTLTTALILAPDSNAAKVNYLRLTAESNLSLINGNTYVNGICGTVNADELIGNFSGSVTLTSPDGKTLKGDAPVPADSVVSNGSDSMKIMIYGDVNRDGKLSASDVSAMMKQISGWKVDVCADAIDLNWDKASNITDVSLLLKKLAGWNVCIGIDIIPKQITLSYYDEECTKMGVMWHASNKTHNPAVQVVEGENGDFTKARTIAGDTDPGIGDSNSRAVMDGLEFGKTYSYRVGDSSGFWSEPYSFTMRDENEDEFSFICFTDSQSKDSDAGSSLRDAFRNATENFPETELYLHCGDIVESVGSGDWTEMIDTSAEYFRRYPMMVVSGNHETSYAGSGGIKMQYNHFNTHMPEQKSVDGGYFYSFNYGDVHFIMLNTNKQGTADDSLSDEQMAWLRADLEANDAKWTVALMHHPIFSTGSGSTDRWIDPMVLAIRAQLAPLFAEYGVDVSLAGHDHIYYCTKPVDGDGNYVADAATAEENGILYYTDPAGVIYTTPGCTGSSSRSLCDTHPEYYRATNEDLKRSYLKVDVKNDSLTVKLCVPDGLGGVATLDFWGIKK